MPQMPGMMSPTGMMPPQAQQPPQQRLDPSTLPSFVQVLEDERSFHSNNCFNTGYPTAEQPPHIMADVLINDTGAFIFSCILRVELFLLFKGMRIQSIYALLFIKCP